MQACRNPVLLRVVGDCDGADEHDQGEEAICAKAMDSRALLFDWLISHDRKYTLLNSFQIRLISLSE